MSLNADTNSEAAKANWLDQFEPADRATIELAFRAAVDQGARRPVELLVLVSLAQRLLATNPEAPATDRARATQVLEVMQADRTAALAFAANTLCHATPSLDERSGR